MDTIILTEEILEKGKSRNGAWSAAQVKLFGISEFRKGWKKNIVGHSFPSAIIQRFLNLKDKHLEKYVVDTDTKKHHDSLLSVDKDLPVDEQYRHPEWLSLRQVILDRDNNTCRICKTKATELHVHHLMYPKNKFVWQIDHKYLITVCRECHETIHDGLTNTTPNSH
jgi:hypothetical protein